jgi:hypothetical protein
MGTELGESWKMLGKLYHWDIWDNHWDKFGQNVLFDISAVRSGKKLDALRETYQAQWFPKENGRHNFTGRWAQKERLPSWSTSPKRRNDLEFSMTQQPP